MSKDPTPDAVELVALLEQGAVDLDHAGIPGGAQLMRDAAETIAAMPSVDALREALEATTALLVRYRNETPPSKPLSPRLRERETFAAP